MHEYLCMMCGKSTTWNESTGKGIFLICPRCHEKIAKRINELGELGDINLTHVITTEVVLMIGTEMEGKRQ